MALSDDRIFEIAEAYGTLDSEYRRAEFARAIEAEVRKQDDVLIRQMESALVDLVEAGEDAWGDERPCVRIGKEEITTARARLESKP